MIRANSGIRTGPDVRSFRTTPGRPQHLITTSMMRPVEG
jgi:hypothetical protein